MIPQQKQAIGNKKLNAAGLTPDSSLVLPERSPEADEIHILQAIAELYSSKSSQSSMSIFSEQVVFTMPTGDVAVGTKGVQAKLESICAAYPKRTVHQRLLQTPESLPARTMCIDQIVSLPDDTSSPVQGVRNLIVLKRRSADGLITSMTEEEGHRRATAPLAARAAGGYNYYSPTDNMVSPCTSKLNLAKKKHHLKGKPTTLFASQLANKAPVSQADLDMEA